jgi:hypothetical protein
MSHMIKKGTCVSVMFYVEHECQYEYFRGVVTYVITNNTRGVICKIDFEDGEHFDNLELKWEHFMNQESTDIWQIDGACLLKNINLLQYKVVIYRLFSLLLSLCLLAVCFHMLYTNNFKTEKVDVNKCLIFLNATINEYFKRLRSRRFL